MCWWHLSVTLLNSCIYFFSKKKSRYSSNLEPSNMKAYSLIHQWSIKLWCSITFSCVQYVNRQYTYVFSIASVLTQSEHKTVPFTTAPLFKTYIMSDMLLVVRECRLQGRHQPVSQSEEQQRKDEKTMHSLQWPVNRSQVTFLSHILFNFLKQNKRRKHCLIYYKNATWSVTYRFSVISVNKKH